MTPEQIARLRAKGVSGLMTPEELAELLAEVENAARLRQLCGDAADEYLRHWNNGADLSDAVYDRLRAASKGNAQAADPIPS